MRVNSDETLRRASEFKRQQGSKSWLELTREPGQQRRSREFFSGGVRVKEDDVRR